MKLKISDIKPNPDNPRVIKDAQYKKLVQSIKDLPKMATIRPIAIDENNVIMGGNQRFRAMQELGWTEIPVVVMTDWTEDEKREFIIKDNRDFGEDDWAKLESWDKNLLEQWGVELPNGFNELEVEEDEAPEVSQDPPVSKLGEIYQLGRHRVMCGDSTDKASVELLMNGVKADMVFTDPPYGIGYDGNKRWAGIGMQNTAGKRNDASVIIGDSGQFDPSFILELFSYCKEIFIWGMQYYPDKLGRGGVIVWNRKTKEQEETPHADFELCWSKQERNSMAWVTWGGWKHKEKGEDRLHTTQKPIELVTWFFDRYKGADIVDLFLGSGSTLIACEQTDRICYGMELDPKYVDVIRKRYAKFIGEEDWQAVTPVVE